MTDFRQRTLASTIGTAGIGLHSGLGAKAVLRPAPPGAGVVFRRTDLDRPLDATLIPARADFVSETRLGVTLRNRAGAEVSTIEHLLAAAFLAGLDNVLIELDGPEAPILDGSARRWADVIRQAGIARQDAARFALIIDRPYRVESGPRFIEIEPYQGCVLDVSVEFPDAAIGRQDVRVSLAEPGDIERVLNARTFCALRDVDAMRASGLALGGSLDNAVVVDGARIVNEGGLRDPQEFALHKTLDIIGDLALVGAPLIGRIRAHKSGHDLHTALARLILKESLKVPKPDLASIAR